MGKKIIIYDIPNEDFSAESGDILFSANPKVEHCRGCFGCWVKTPGKCVINDRCNVIFDYIAQCDEVVVISPILYGGYSVSIKAVIDRFIPYVLPYFRIVSGEMHHKMRYKNPFKLCVYFYGECDEDEKRIARSLVKANALNFGSKSYNVKFLDTVCDASNELRGEVL